MNNMNDEEIKNLIAQNGRDGNLNCATAFVISKEHNVPLKKIGELCNEMKIKIRNCQLGCFQ